MPQAAKWVDKVGLALLFPKADVVLPSLWEQVSGLQVTDWDTEEMKFFWWAKDELPGRGLTCVGRHLARSVSCIAPRQLPTLVALDWRRKEAAAVLDEIAEGRDDPAGFRIWTPR